MLLCVQNDLFDLGADLCVPPSLKGEPEPLRIVQSQVDRLERKIDELNAELEPLRSFVLPGGSPAAAALHLARTVTRRAERLLVALAEAPGEEVGGPALRYINRLSDFLFVAARYVNQKGEADILWVPGQNR
jgi:cob(I)alamin adenosyltransferase